MKKILAIILALVSLVGITAMGASAQVEAQEKEPLKFGDDGKFKILQISDIQDRIIFRPLTKMFIEDLLE